MKNKPLIVGITGGSGSGKTTFIRQIRDSFTNDQLSILSQDDYYLPREVQKVDNQGITNFDLPGSIDKKRFRKDLEKLISGEDITIKEYVFNNESAAPKTLTIPSAPVIIVEGLFVFHYKKVRNLIDLKVFLQAKENLKVIRRIKRDRVERNYPIEDVLYRYQHHVLPTYEKYIRPYQDIADVVINNNDNFDMGLKVILGFLKDYLKSPS